MERASSGIGAPTSGGSIEEIHAWLREVTGLADIPPFEEDSVSVATLGALMHANRVADEKATVYAAGIEKLAHDYAADAARLSSVLDTIGCRTGYNAARSAPGVDWSSTLADLAHELQLSSPLDADYVLALADLAERRQRAERSHAAEAARLARLEASAARAAQQRQAATSLLQRLGAEADAKDRAVSERKAGAAFLDDKVRKYQANAAALERQLVESGGADPSVRHERLLERAERLATVGKQLESVRSRLAAYRDLPADAALARTKLEQAKMELAHLEAKLTQHIDQMGL